MRLGARNALNCWGLGAPGGDRSGLYPSGRLKVRWPPAKSAINAEITAEFAALSAADGKLSAGRAANRVDAAGVFAVRCPEMNASSVGPRCERGLAKMAWLNGRGDIRSPHAFPAHQVLGWNQQAAIVSAAAARPAQQTVERLLSGSYHVSGLHPGGRSSRSVAVARRRRQCPRCADVDFSVDLTMLRLARLAALL